MVKGFYLTAISAFSFVATGCGSANSATEIAIEKKEIDFEHSNLVFDKNDRIDSNQLKEQAFQLNSVATSLFQNMKKQKYWQKLTT